MQGSKGGDKIESFPWKTRGSKCEHVHRRRDKLAALSVNLEKKVKNAACITNTFYIGACLAPEDETCLATGMRNSWPERDGPGKQRAQTGGVSVKCSTEKSDAVQHLRLPRATTVPMLM